MEEYSHPEINKLIDIVGNNECFDCGISMK